MNSACITIDRFLEGFPMEVRSCGKGAVSPELAELIARFAAGDLSDDEMLALYRELRGNEYAMEMLASALNGG